jgi:hypothetical protein
LSSLQRLDKEFVGLFQEGNNEGGDDGRGGRDSGGGFMQRFGWIYQATIIAEHERIKLSEVYELPTIQALNDLSYLKSKTAHDREQIKQAYAKHN